MTISVGKMAPRVIVLAAVAYCAWPSVSELTSESTPPPAKKVADLPAALFSPAMPPCPARNPFGGKDAAALAAATRSPAAAGETGARPKPAASAAAKLPDKPLDPLGGLKLDATCILGDQRLAMINGQLYASREKLPAGNAAPPFRIVSVLPYKVLLERDGKTLELTYANVASRPAAAVAASRPSRPQAVSAGAEAGGANRAGRTGK